MNKSVAWRSLAIQVTKTSVLECNKITKLQELATRILLRVGGLRAMVQMSFNFTPACETVTGQTLQQTLVILLGRIKVSVDERAFLTVAPAIKCDRVLPAPAFKPTFLLVVRCPGRTINRNNTRLKMVGHRND